MINLNYGEKLTKLKDSLNIKYFADYGKIVGVSGDWLNDNSKKENPSAVNIQNLIKIADYHNISLDYFFREDINTIENNELQPNDVGFTLEDLKRNIDNYESFYNIKLNDEAKRILLDGIEVLKGLVKSKL